MRHLMALLTSTVVAQGAAAQNAIPIEMPDADLINATLTFCVSPAAETRTAFFAAAQANGFNEVGSVPLMKLTSFENDGGVTGTLSITALNGQPGLFDCSVSSSGSHDRNFRASLAATLNANYSDVQDFPLANGWIFYHANIEYVASTATLDSIGTTLITVSFSGLNN